jgi:uncharacterized membrane protein YfcA
LTTWLLLSAVVLLAYTTQTTIGFAAMVIAITLGTFVVADIPTLLAILLPTSLIMTGAIVARNPQQVDRRLLLTRILPLMVAGGAVGYLVAERAANGRTLERVYGGLVVLFALSQFWRIFADSRRDEAVVQGPMPPAVSAGFMLAAGVIHGIYASGGPLLVYAVSRLRLDKSVFRTTLCTVFLILNTTLTVVFAIEGKIGAESLMRSASLLPVVLLSLVLGEWLHGRVDEKLFRLSVLVLLLFAGAVLVLR